MFEAFKASKKLKANGYALKASAQIPMCYEIITPSGKVHEKLYVWRADGYWYCGKNIGRRGGVGFRTPEQAALLKLCNDFV
jgi:hypothetical protein